MRLRSSFFQSAFLVVVIVAIASFLLGTRAQSQNAELSRAPISDPRGILDIADKFLGDVSFENAYKLGDQAIFETWRCEQECSPDGCKEVCKGPLQQNIKVKTRAPDEITLEISETDTRPYEVNFSRAVYEKYKGNYLRAALDQMALRSMPALGITRAPAMLAPVSYVEVKEYAYVHHRLQNGTLIEGMKIDILYQISFDDGENYTSFPVQYVLGRNIPVVGQILFHQFQESKPNQKLIAIERK